MNNSNAKIRKTITSKGLKYWEVARETGISPSTLTVWLREPLTLEKRERVLKGINEALKKQKEFF